MAQKAKQITNRVKSSGKVVRAATTHKTHIAKTLAERAKVVQGNDTKATLEVFEAVIDFLADNLSYSANALDKAEGAVAAERADDVQPREERDTLEAELTAKLVRVRSNVQDALGPEGVKAYGLAGTQPRRGHELTSHAANVADLMRKTPFTVSVDGVTYASDGMAAALESRVSVLAGLFADLEREEQELGDALGRRNLALEDWNDAYQGVADSLTGLFRIARRKDLSERVRPTSRVLSGEEEGPEIEGEATEEPKKG